MSSSIVLFGAMYFELKPLLRKLHVIHEWREKETHLFEARYRDLPVWVVRTGVGKKKAEMAARQLLQKVSPKLGLSVGLCGAIDPSLQVGQTILSRTLPGFNHSKLTKWVSGRIVSVDQVLGPDEKQKIRSQISDALACDMESSALASVFQERQIPFAVLRTVSDRLDAELPPNEILIQKNIVKQIRMLVAHYQWRFPRQFFHLLRLGRDCRRAAQFNSKEVLKFLTFFVDSLPPSP